MAKFTGGDLRLKDGQRVTFGTDLDSHLYWNNTASQMEITTVISGVDPTADYHLTTKQYVDELVASGTGLSHNILGGLQGGVSNEYYHLTSTQHSALTSVGGVADASTEHTHDDRYYTETEVDNLLTTLSGDLAGDLSSHVNDSTIHFTESSIDHGSISGLDGDDHTQYILVDGSRGFTGTVSGVYPTVASHLTTKQYVDESIDEATFGLDWQDSVLDFTVAASGVQSTGNRYVSTSTAGGWTEDYIYEWDGSQWNETVPNEGYALWDETNDRHMVYNGSDWVRFGSTITHNYLNGLQGGTTDQYYHMTSTQHSALTSFGGVGNASSEHIHDDRYYTETEVDGLLTTLSGDLQSDIDNINNDFDENAQDAVGGIMVGAGSVTVTYDDGTPQITISGTIPVMDHGGLTGLGDDDHTQYILVNGSRGFTATVSGVTPTEDYHLATKAYVDEGGVDRHGRQAIGNGVDNITVNFSDIGSTDYTINATLENTSDTPPSIYAFIVSARTSSSFTVTLMGDTDSANYVLNWSVIED